MLALEHPAADAERHEASPQTRCPPSCRMSWPKSAKVAAMASHVTENRCAPKLCSPLSSKSAITVNPSAMPIKSIIALIAALPQSHFRFISFPAFLSASIP